MEFAASLPSEFKLRFFVKKYLLKKAIRDLVPGENIHRGKMGFGVPIGRWFRHELKGFVSEILLSPASIKRGYFRPQAVKGMVEEHLECRRDHTFQLWSLLMLELWHRRFMD